MEDNKDYTERKSRYRDLVYFKSTNANWLNICAIIDKPEKKSSILVSLGGLFEDVPVFQENETTPSKFLKIQIGLRGGKYSDGISDLNGFELLDVIDAVEMSKKLYRDFIDNADIVYLEGRKNASTLELLNKFPDYFTSAVSIDGISDLRTVKNPKIEKTLSSDTNSEIYKTRSAIDGIKNLYSPLCIMYGGHDSIIPIEQSINYRVEAGKKRRARFIEMHNLNGKGEKACEIAEKHRMMHNTPIEIPRKGKLVIKGYIVTKKFSVYLRDINRIAEFHYDIDKGKYHVECAEDVCYTIRFPLKKMDYDD